MLRPQLHSRSFVRVLLLSFVALASLILGGLKYHSAAITTFNAINNTTTRIGNAANTPPKIISVSPFTVGQGYTNFDVEIASVSDTETPAKDLRVTITSGTQAISLVGLSNINGKVITQIYVPCSIAFGNYPIGLKVTDGDGLEGVAEFIIIVTHVTQSETIR